MPLDRLERLTDLVLVLLHASSPRTLAEVGRLVPGYPESPGARRQAFERDKRVLREEGIPLVTEPVDGPEQYGYRIDPAAFYLPDLGLEPDEQAALHLAVAGVHLGDPSGRDALAKLGTTGVAEARPVASLVAAPALVPLFSALRAGAEVRFSYRGEERVVAPGRLAFRGGRWYLAAWDRGRGAARTFRVDRIEGTVTLGAPGSAATPDSAATPGSAATPAVSGHGALQLEVPEDERGDDQLLVLVDPVEAPRVVAEVGERAVAERRRDGSVVLRLGVTSFGFLRSWVLGLGDHAEVVGPPEARAAVVAWLERAREAAPADATLGAAGSRGKRPPTEAGSGRDAGPHRRGGDPGPAGRRALAASARLRRLLAMVAWLAEVGEAPVKEIAARFDIPEDEVARELELAACCGLPPYTPDVLLEIVVTGDTVQAFLPKDLARPRRLTPAEGFALAASARTILAVPGADRDGALARALAKLDAALGDHRRLVIELDAPPRLGEVRDLLDAGVQAEIGYHSASTDETSVRVVEPLGLLSLDGHWYLDAWCHRAGGERRFRVDRIRGLRQLEDRVEHAGDRSASGAAGASASGAAGAAAFVPGPGAIEVRLRLGPEARWVVDTVPILEGPEPVAGEDGQVEVTLAVGGRAWLDRLLLQLGPHARVVAPPEMAGAGAAAADRLLRRYR